MPDMQTLSESRVRAFSSFPNDVEIDLGGNLLQAMTPHNMTAIQRGSVFGYVAEGTCEILTDHTGAILHLTAGFYFSVRAPATLLHTSAKGILVHRRDYCSFLHIGVIEHEGRLRYIDGCTDSLLIPPIKRGDPCLNLLYFPPGIDQTMHTHPSERIGMILSGKGICITPDDEIPLKPGMLFCIHPNGQHKFRTVTSDMRVLAYHPDSDFGPTDEDHPMINRTMVDGVSAAKIPALHTR